METENRLIAEFMGFELQNNPNERWFNQWFTKETLNKPYNSRIEILHFDTDWNWLMEVVEKIESLTDINSNGCFMVLESIGFNAKFIFDDGTRILKDNKGETKIEAVYNACLDFIKWYNEQK